MNSDYTSDEWRRIGDEFKRIKDTVYLDHAGTALYSEVQLANVYALLGSTVLSNPHTSKHTDDLLDQVRFRVLGWLNASADEYSVVFTSGATAALKTVAECFAFDNAQQEHDVDDDDDAAKKASTRNGRGQFAYLTDNHTSVLGMRAIVNTEHISSVSHAEFMERCSSVQKLNDNDDIIVDNGPDSTNSLFVYPGQCNFSGSKYPLHVIADLQRSGPFTTTHQHHHPQTAPAPTNWYVMLDAASLIATGGPLDLSRHRADFVCLSFYKLFGYPTGLGALLISRRGAAALHKRYYGGGTVQIALASADWHRKRPTLPVRRLHERFEDGTVAFLSAASVLAGFETLERLVPGATALRIERHCSAVARHLFERLRTLRYANGAAVVRLYHDDGAFEAQRQGGIVNFNVLHADGAVVGFREIGEIAQVCGVTLRTGCFCNPGACQRHLRLTDEQIRHHFASGHVCGDSVDLVDGVPTGSVRVSCGYITRISDVERVVRMIEDTYVKQLFRRKSTTLHQNGLQPNARPAGGSIRLLEICVFPIKSCAAHRVQSGRWPLTGRGLRYDREWMIVNGRTGVALTQKTCTRMCLVRPSIDAAGARMWLSYPDYPETVSVPLKVHAPDGEDRRSVAELCVSKVCGDRIEGTDCGDAVAAWLSDVLCEPDVRLIRQRPDDGRRCPRRRAAASDAAAAEAAAPISLVNQAPFLLINRVSVRWLTEQVDAWMEARDAGDDDDSVRLSLEENTVARFRGNLVVGAVVANNSAEERGAENNHHHHGIDARPENVLGAPLQELEWRRIRVGRVPFRVQGPCTRCQMICIDQASGEKTAEPLRTIARVFGGKMRFGVYVEYDLESAAWDWRNGGFDNDDVGEKMMFLECGDRVHLEEINECEK